MSVPPANGLTRNDKQPTSDPVQRLLEVLDLHDSGARTTEEIYTAVSHEMPNNRIFGGQVLAQSLLAAGHTLPAERRAHSMHGYFLRPGDPSRPLTYSVDHIHDGRSFSTRRTQAYQQGVPIFSMIASFQDEDEGLEHQAPMPDVPGPEDLPAVDSLPGQELTPTHPGLDWQRPMEMRPVEPLLTEADPQAAQPHQSVWIRMRAPLNDDPRLHRVALTYMSDLSLQGSVLRAHGLSFNHPGMKMASLDHAMWWHRDGRADQWLLYTHESPNARGSRGLATGRIYSRDGALLATVAQEMMLRVP